MGGIWPIFVVRLTNPVIYAIRGMGHSTDGHILS